jgi:hypothetical protein
LGPLVWSTTICDQVVVWSEVGNTTTCNDLAVANNVASASIMEMNDVICSTIPNGTYCATESCQIAVLTQDFNADMFLASSTAYENITITQFQNWNAYINLNSIRKGECW